MTRGPVPAPTAVVLRALGIGDLLTAVPALRAIRRAAGGQYRTVLATSAGLVRFAGQLDVVDEVVPARGLTGLPASLHDAAVGVNLHGRGPESHRVLVAARPRRLELLRWYRGRLTPVEIDASDANALRLPLLPGDRINWE